MVAAISARMGHAMTDEDRIMVAQTEEILRQRERIAELEAVALTADEIETVKALINDWGFEYSLRADRLKVEALGNRFGAFSRPGFAQIPEQ